MDDTQNHDKPVQYLTFQLGGHEYALAIMQVREIVEFGDLTGVPRTPLSIRGVINLHGSVIPVVDLAPIFGLNLSPITARTCIIVVETNWEGERSPMGIIADVVSRVAQWSDRELLPTAPTGSAMGADCFKGMARDRDKFVILLDINKVFLNPELKVSEAIREL
jgi:purine-binding chemotaxis protein CheW